jgi:hypothetical protein
MLRGLQFNIIIFIMCKNSLEILILHTDLKNYAKILRVKIHIT